MWFHLRLLEKCNLHCSHCYARERDRTPLLDFSMIGSICSQIEAIERENTDRTVVYLSGGEPFLHPDFWAILDFVNSRGFIDRVNILTNGIPVPECIDRLISYRSKTCVQVSIDGDETAHDALRGAGTFAKAKHALYALNEADIPHWISFTVSTGNVHCYRAVLDLAKATGSRHNNVTPYTGVPDQMLSYREWKEFKYRYERYADRIGLHPSHGPNCCGFKYTCGAFNSGLTVNPDGTATGCARDNQVCGSYEKLGSLVSWEAGSIHTACMRMKWGGMERFSLITKLE